jgi:thioredoxin 2
MNDPLQIVCPHCDALNKTIPARIKENPKCGKCHNPLFTGKPVELTSVNFHIHTTNSDIPVLVDFWAPWCGPCKIMAPQFLQAAAELEPRFRLAKVNTESEQMLGARYNIQSIPTMALFIKGREKARQSGAVGAADIVRWAKNHI